MPTIILGDFNDNLLSLGPSPLLQLMSSRRFSQLVEVPTTDFGSLLDHIYYNGTANNTLIDVIDTYYSDHDAMYPL
jgi:endonuclease/exonuclease/phosphatase (EEP) superfamily protein YafD